MTDDKNLFSDYNNYRKRNICLCGLVTEDEIIAAIKHGFDTIELIQQHTNAAKNCQSCLPKIQEIIENNKK